MYLTPKTELKSFMNVSKNAAFRCLVGSIVLSRARNQQKSQIFHMCGVIYSAEPGT